MSSPTRPHCFDVPATSSDHALCLRGRMREATPGAAKHKIVYVRRGRLGLHGEKGSWTIVAGLMVFIPAARAYAIETDAATELILAHLDPAIAPWHRAGCWTTTTAPLAREMLLHAICWSPEQAAVDPVARSFFRTLGLLAPGWFTNERIMWVPRGHSPAVERAVRFALANLAVAEIETAARAAGLTDRTLRRRFKEETGLTWRQFLRDARLARALDLLTTTPTRVSDVAQGVGFRSLAAFNRAFCQWIGGPPGAYARDRRADALGSLQAKAGSGSSALAGGERGGLTGRGIEIEPRIDTEG